MASPEFSAARIALGCGNFGGIGSVPELFGRGLTDDQAFALMDAAWDAGIDHFDTADAYGGGHSEQAIGQWIAARGVRPRPEAGADRPAVAHQPGPARRQRGRPVPGARLRSRGAARRVDRGV